MLMGRRKVILALSATFAALGADRSRAADAVDYPLWLIERERSRVYVLGHTPPQPTDWEVARIQNLLGKCEVLWNETNHTVRSNMPDLLQRYGLYSDRDQGIGLTQHDLDRLAQALKIVNIAEDSIRQFRPWLKGQTLEGAFFSAPGYGGRNAEAVLVAEARTAGLTLSSEFAAMDDTVRWFGELSPVQDIQYLRYILDEVLVGHEEGQRIYADWAKGQDACAVEWVARMKRLYPELYRSIVIERNRSWISRIQSMLTDRKPAMVVVGLYHLVGPDSIQAQLGSSGLTARRI